ncbi:hypothetical protein L5B97_05570 [Avibacterium sp. 20-15]|uniref:hypothetical protein n=1 Tax=unclassified Avibacterium TaxID=2685287 RepID=UPI0020267B68|nr:MULTISPECIES: hypothetical protein [unclassified Avibacterium]MCW9732958.1 hypothetical protein [Avibacterium sp. 20-15]URL05091.1 hypothetical protein L4F93_04260 [Avibacterium sp. 20-132]
MLNKVIDFTKINEAEQILAKNKVLYNNKSFKAKFKDAQNIIKYELDKLRKTGLTSRRLEYLWEMNYNRPDRDRIENAPSIICIDDYNE